MLASRWINNVEVFGMAPARVLIVHDNERGTAAALPGPATHDRE
jgi:hypothetical protein